MANESKPTPEILDKIKEAVLNAKSAEDILAVAKQNNIEITAEIATDLFDRHHKSGELSDDELGNVAGGGCYDQEPLICQRCGGELKFRWMGNYSLLHCPVCDADEF